MAETETKQEETAEKTVKKETKEKPQAYIKAGKRRLSLRVVRNALVGLTLIVFGFGMGFYYRERGGNWIPTSTSSAAVPLDRNGYDFSLFWNVWDTLQQKYLEPDKVVPQKMIYGAISGMTASLGDPYTVFLPPSDNQAAKEDLNGEFDGVGIQLGYKDGTLAVMSPLADHPAIKQGVKAGDLILHIKDTAAGTDKDTTGMSLTEAVKLIRGKKGTPVTLTLYRPEKGSFEVTIVRDTILIPAVDLEYGQVVDGKWQKSDSGPIAWVKVHRFGDSLDTQWSKVVDSIVVRRDSIKGMVLDLRNNPGGYVVEAVDLASEFIPEGTIVKQQGRTESQTYSVSKRGRLIGMPMDVLINGGSASASEILAGALRDRLQVKLVGEKSFGKGTVQEAMDITGGTGGSSGAGLHVTIARWLLPSGDWIHETGLTPDIEVKLPEATIATEAANLVDTQLVKASEILQ